MDGRKPWIQRKVAEWLVDVRWNNRDIVLKTWLKWGCILYTEVKSWSQCAGR
jgi:hypothetical protein